MGTEVKKIHFKAVRMLTATTLLWAVSFPIVKAMAMAQAELLPGSSTWFQAALTSSVRFGVAGVVLGALIRGSLRGITRLEMWQGAGLGFFSAGGMLFQMDGLAYTSASVSAFLTQTFCVWVPVIVALRDRRWPPGRVLAATAAVIAGVAVLTEVNPREMKLGRGEWETLVAAIFFAGQIVWLDRPVFSRNDPNRFSVVMFLTMMLISLPLLAVTWESPRDVAVVYGHWPMHVLMAALVIFCTLGAFVLMNRWQPFVPATEAAVIYGAEPVLASTYALFLPGLISAFSGIDYANEELTGRLFLGGLMIVGANLYIQLGWRTPKGGQGVRLPRGAKRGRKEA